MKEHETENQLMRNGYEAPFSIFLGEKVLIRANREGMNIGVVHHIDYEFVYLKDARKFWRCIAFESLVESGPSEGTRATASNPLMCVRLDDICGAKIVSDEIWQKFINWPISEQD